MTKTKEELNENDLECLRMGRAMMLAGMRNAVRVLHEQIDQVERQLYVPPPSNGVIKPSMQRTLAKIGIALPAEAEAAPVRRRGRGRGRRRKAAAGYWARLTPEQRSIEMRRRRAVSKAKHPKASHPRYPGHPGHEEWLNNMRKATRKAWNNLTPAEREARLKKAQAGRYAKSKPVIKMEKTA